MKKSYLLLLLFFCSLSAFSQEYFPKNDGVKTESHTITAFTNAKIYVTPTQVIENGTLLIQDGKVLRTGTNVSIPKNATVVDLTGKSIYPSFIDPYSDFGIKKPKRNPGSWRSAPQYDAQREGYYWNDHIRPDTNPLEKFAFDNKKATDLLKAGFGAVNTHMHDGIVRGNGMLIALNSNADNSLRILDNRSAQYLSYQKSNTSKQSYPTSLMGSMALIRQMYHDADWYAKGNAKRTDLALEALNANKNLVQIFHSGSKHNSIKTDAIGDEFGIQYVLVGDGTEYENIAAMKATNASFIIPINFPKAYDVSDPYSASVVELEAMKHWNQAPSNPKALLDNGIPFSFTMHSSKSGKEFKGNLMKAIKYGLDKTKALEALTTVPARILKQEDKVGSLQNGRQANFLITSGDIFDAKTVIYENWVQGNQNVFQDKSHKDLRGKYTFNVAGNNYDVTIAGSPKKLKATVMKDSLKLGSKIAFKNDWLQLQFTTPDTTKTEFIRLTAPVRNVKFFSGKAIVANGSETSFNATQKEVSESKDKKGKGGKMEAPKMLPLSYPNGAYGATSLPKQETVLFRNATVWTNEKDGILQNTDVLVKDGKIARIGKNLSAGNARIVDATGKHLTAGVIDEHSHIAAFAINEAGHNSTAEVNMADVVNPEDVDIYRNLAGGVTTIQLLHGSANPIGGRSAILSLRWGRSADEMLFKDADGFIKFALGENVKQSNWGDTETTRFPQTRMGVEQVFTDYFQRAKEYEAKKKSGNYRYDIEMETILEILNKKRFVSCHSYVQSEINMLMKVADKFDFNINTFTHILEGYKVADKMKAHGAGGSTFSDWWAYKYEVNDAIPYNGAIMHNQGVVVAFNSDDGEMSRRLNQEAAKAVKYGGVSEEEAWKFVTLNPAKLLHIDDKVGSIKTGKQADLVLWTDHPMSIYTKAQTTMIEGTVYFDLERDAQLRRKIDNERNELMNMMLLEKNKGMKTQPAKKKDKVHHHCDTVEF